MSVGFFDILQLQGVGLAVSITLPVIILPDASWEPENKSNQVPLSSALIKSDQTPLSTLLTKSTEEGLNSTLSKSDQDPLDTQLTKTTSQNDWGSDPKNTEF